MPPANVDVFFARGFLLEACAFETFSLQRQSWILPPQTLDPSLRRAFVGRVAAFFLGRGAGVSEFWCASCRRHRPLELRGGKIDRFRIYCKECYARRQKAMEAIGRRQAGDKP
jgi:hypothetical protein